MLLLPTLPSKWPEVVLTVALVKTAHWLSASLMSSLNKAPRASINSSGSRAFTLILTRAHCLLCSLFQSRAIYGASRSSNQYQWLLRFQRQYFLYLPARAPASAPLLTKEPFKQHLKTQLKAPISAQAEP